MTGVAVTALVALVAVASRAHRPGGGSGSRGHAPALLLEYLGVMALIAILVGGALMIWALAEDRRLKALAGPNNWRRTLAGLAFGVLIVLVLAFATRNLTQNHRQGPRGTTGIVAPLKVPTVPKKLQPKAGQDNHNGWLAALVISSVLVGIGLAVATAIRQRRRHGEEMDEEAALARALDEVLADTLDDLREERDPRKAVIRSYARMEKIFAAYRVPRDPAETPLEYVGRALASLSVSAHAVRSLTVLYERAKFSTHEVDSRMKDDAIETLVGLRSELETAEEVAA